MNVVVLSKWVPNPEGVPEMGDDFAEREVRTASRHAAESRLCEVMLTTGLKTMTDDSSDVFAEPHCAGQLLRRCSYECPGSRRHQYSHKGESSAGIWRPKVRPEPNSEPR